MNRSISFWERYKRYVFGVVLLILTQSLLIDLPKSGAVKIEVFAETALDVFNFAIDPFSREIDK